LIVINHDFDYLDSAIKYKYDYFAFLTSAVVYEYNYFCQCQCTVMITVHEIFDPSFQTIFTEQHCTDAPENNGHYMFTCLRQVRCD